MTYIQGFRNPTAARRLIALIHALSEAEPLRIMEFCGGHTHAIMRYGLREALAPAVELLSGPGCPVCVSASADIDQAIALSQKPGVTVATFGDMIRVPGSRGSLQEARAQGGDVQVVYSALDSLSLARSLPERIVVMLGIGFETTAPTIAAAVAQAQAEGLHNWCVYSMHKLTEPAMRAILEAGEVRLDAVLGPGHVAAITGWRAWEFLPREYGVPCAVSGFEPTDILQAILSLMESRREGVPRVINSYGRGVSAEGNAVAQGLMAQVFRVAPAAWRGIGLIPASGLDLADAYALWDARRRFDLPPLAEGPLDAEAAQGCRCGEILRGMALPPECPLFEAVCTPPHPVGPCMVSAEGACAAYYRYGRSAV